MKSPMRWSFACLALLAVGGGADRIAVSAVDKHESAVSASKGVTHGAGPAYRAFGELPMMHIGRVKPIDTVAREEIKSIFTRETIKLPGKDGKPGSTWMPVAAFLDWSVRPKFWDEQPIIAVEYLPLKRMIFAEEVHLALEGIAGKAATPEATRTRLKELTNLVEVDASEIRNVVRDSGLPKEDGELLLALAAKIGEETKWLAPEDLENAQVSVEGKATPLMAWFEELAKRRVGTNDQATGKPRGTDLERKGAEVAERLGHYRAIRDREALGMVPLLAMPRPANKAMFEYTQAAVRKVQESGESTLTTLESETLAIFSKYLQDIPGKDRIFDGSDPTFEPRYLAWLKAKSAWVPLHVIRGASIDELTRAGFPSDKVEAFRAAFKAVEDEESLHPGLAESQPTLALIHSASDLGGAINPEGYPSPGAMAREVHFNDLAPFFQAPIAYLVGVLMLIMSLVASSFGKSMKMESAFGKLSKVLYALGLAGFAGGIALEVYGFYLRVRITGWAPVSNMYETVIWVALVTSILGLVLEAIYRKTYAALAASGVALVGTWLAATVPLLDPTIHSLPPVLRSNFWLSIHVLTIVSSYAAFALAMGLGLVATTAYLTATYKRSASLGELATPLALGIPIFGVGTGVAMMSDRLNLGPIWTSYGSYGAILVASVGGLLVGMSLFAIVGELINKVIAVRQIRHAETVALARNETATLSVGSIAQGSSSVATMEPPTATATATATDTRRSFDPESETKARALAMRHTASQIKPMASFIYRSMQVGILLVAAGTFLGGWWADVSWGRFWGWDPKEVWALITLLVYLMPLHGRFAGWVNTFWLVMASVVCFLSVLMAWYGVNFVLGVGLHSYGFTEGGSQGSVGFATLVVLAFAAGAFWRRKVSSVVPVA